MMLSCQEIKDEDEEAEEETSGLSADPKPTTASQQSTEPEVNREPPKIETAEQALISLVSDCEGQLLHPQPKIET